MRGSQFWILYKCASSSDILGEVLTLDFIQKASVDYFTSIPDVDALYLFGSYADGSATLSSDVDLGVLYKRHLPPQVVNDSFLRDWALVARALGTDNVDLICLNTTHSIELKYAIIQDGICLIDRSGSLAEYEVNIKAEYYDHIAALKRAGYLS